MTQLSLCTAVSPPYPGVLHLRLWKADLYCTISWKGLEHLHMLVSVEAPRTTPPWITKDTCIYKLQARKKNHSTETLNGIKPQLRASQCYVFLYMKTFQSHLHLPVILDEIFLSFLITKTVHRALGGQRGMWLLYLISPSLYLDHHTFWFFKKSF